MKSVPATFRNGRVELAESVDWPDGTAVEVVLLNHERHNGEPPMTQWPDAFFSRLQEEWGEEPFQRPPQGDFEVRENW